MLQIKRLDTGRYQVSGFLIAPDVVIIVTHLTHALSVDKRIGTKDMELDRQAIEAVQKHLQHLRKESSLHLVS